MTEALPSPKEPCRRRRCEYRKSKPDGVPAARFADQPAQEQRAPHAERSDQGPAALVGAAAAGRREARHGGGHGGAEDDLAEAVADGADEDPPSPPLSHPITSKPPRPDCPPPP